jgi:hypothetical protein
MEEIWPCRSILSCCFFIMSYLDTSMDSKRMMGYVGKNFLFTYLDYLLSTPYNPCVFSSNYEASTK